MCGSASGQRIKQTDAAAQPQNAGSRTRTACGGVARRQSNKAAAAPTNAARGGAACQRFKTRLRRQRTLPAARRTAAGTLRPLRAVPCGPSPRARW
eukprot:361138-Chlamydomonas_euryale.AAC.2